MKAVSDLIGIDRVSVEALVTTAYQAGLATNPKLDAEVLGDLLAQSQFEGVCFTALKASEVCDNKMVILEGGFDNDYPRQSGANKYPLEPGFLCLSQNGKEVSIANPATLYDSDDPLNSWKPLTIDDPYYVPDGPDRGTMRPSGDGVDAAHIEALMRDTIDKLGGNWAPSPRLKSFSTSGGLINRRAFNVQLVPPEDSDRRVTSYRNLALTTKVPEVEPEVRAAILEIIGLSDE